MDENVSVKGLRMLLVEDDVESGKAMALMLEHRGIDLTWLQTVDAALVAFDPARCDVVVADVILGNASGIDVLKHVRERAPRFPVIFITGYDSLSSAIQAVRLKADDYILKPFMSIDDLLIPVCKAVERARLLAENERLHEQLRDLNSKLVLVEERERRALAQGLHDSVGQMLVACRLQIPDLTRHETDREYIAKLQCIDETLNQAIRETRLLVFDLSPPSLYELGLLPALTMLADQFRHRYGLETKVIGQELLTPMPEDVGVVLYRSIRELLLNVVKHSQEKNATVHLWNDDGQARAAVSDAGIGFDPAVIKTRTGPNATFGLISIRERLRHLGGNMTIESAPGQGCTVTLEIPLPVADENAPDT